MRQQLAALGIQRGDVLIVHSSMKAIGTTRTPQEVIEELMAAVGEEGTLMFPALTYEYVTAAQPEFWRDRTPPCIGLLPRTFRTMPGVVRSIHPTHSVCAWGRLAEEVTRDHILDETPVGPNSPYRKLPKYNGKILMIGEILHATTFMHGVEEAAGAPYMLTEHKIRYVVEGQERFHYRHDFGHWDSEYGRLQDILSYPDIRTGLIGSAPSYLIDAQALMREGVKRIQGNPYYFVTDSSQDA